MASQFKLKKDAAANIATPATNKQAFFIDSDDKFKKKLDTGTVVDLESGLTYTDEDAQDAVGTILVDTASLDLTYNDGVPSISGTVLPAGVDHNSLANYVSAQHVNHTSVSIATAATSGIAGGGDISATRNLSLNIDGMTEESTDVSVDDTVAIYDVSAASHKKVKRFRLAQPNNDRFINSGSDFITETLGGLTTLAVGTGASAQASTFGIDFTDNTLGAVQLDTGTTATGRVTLSTASLACLISGNAALKWSGRFAPEVLSNGTESFTLYAGFIDNTGAGDHTDGCYFRQNDAVNSGRWEAVVAAGASRIALDTGINPTTSYTIFEVQINAAGTTATFYIDGTLVATHSTGVPNGNTQAFGHGVKMEKSVGTTQRNLSWDWWSFSLERSAAR